MTNDVRASFHAVRELFFFSSSRRHTRSLCDWSSDVCSSDLPNLVHAPSSNCGNGHLANCIDATAYALPPKDVYVYGNAGRNVLHGPGLFNIDYSLFKNFPIKERLKLQFRAEFFNFLNHPNFSNPASTFGTETFGDITSTSTENRDIQFGLRLVF